MRTAINLLTAIGIIGICGISVFQGWSIVDFSLAMANGDSPKKRAQIIGRWAAVPGLASTVLQAELIKESNSSEWKGANHRRETLAAILSINPMSSIDWLSLAQVQLATGQPIKQVLGSLKLSVLTGPNEASVMAERGIFAISIWDNLPQDLKNHVAIDLGSVFLARTPAEGDMGGRVRVAISAETDRVRKELREALLATGLSREAIEQRLGL